MSSRADARDGPREPRGMRGLMWALFLGLLAGSTAWFAARPFLYASEILVDLAGPAPKAKTTPNGSTLDLVVPHEGGAARARLYVPQSAPHRCIVIGHGVHYKSIDEPRLVRFSTELAKAGAVVLTPELAELADYRVTRSGAEVLGASVLELARRCPAHASSQVGLLGFSFAGGLALLAATEPDVSARLAYVASVGGYQDLSRVLSFLLTDVVSAPSGSVHRKAHEYGIVVLLYENLDSFVPEEDLPCMREAVRAWLHEDRAMAWALASERSTARSEELFMALVTGKNDQLREALRRVLSGETETLRSLSPVTRLGTIPVPVYLLHGTGDSVIPPEETRWGEKELDGRSHRALVTPLIEHVELDAHFRVMDAFDLVQFMAGLI